MSSSRGKARNGNTGDRAVMLFAVFEWPKYECSDLMKKEVNHFYIDMYTHRRHKSN